MHIDGTTSSSGLARLIAGRLAMPHADLAEPVPGLCALLTARPSSGLGLSELTERLLRGDSALGEDERELIAAYVAYLGQAPLRAGGRPGTGVGARVGDRMRALLPIARKVHADPLTVTTQDVADARAAGVDDTAIHDTVLIAAVMCMFRRYGEALGALPPHGATQYVPTGRFLATQGCLLPAGG